MKSAKPKHKVIYEYLRNGIARGEFMPDGRLPTEVELSARFGVSRPTATRAFTELEREGLIERKRGAGSFVRKTGTGARRVFGVIVTGIFSRDDMNYSIFNQVLGEMGAHGQELGCSLLFHGALNGREPGELTERAGRIADYYATQKVAGVFFMPLLLPPAEGHANRELAERMAQRGLAVVLLDRDIYDYPRRGNFDLVGMDNYQAGYLLGRHLAERGAKRPIFLTTPCAASTVQARIEGFSRALQEAGLPAEGVVQTARDFDATELDALLARLRPDAVAAYNDDVAAFAETRLLAQGLRIPEDTMLAGFDDSVVSAHLPVPLTTVAQPWRQIGRAAIETMVCRLESPGIPASTLSFAPQLIARRSTGF